MNRVRLDVLLLERGLFPSREAAKRAIMAGLVRRNQEVVDKPGTFVHPEDVFQVIRPSHQYVGRGGLKLERALTRFQIDLHQRVVVDVGSSTGGFTDCALQRGARIVYAVDVGYGQLDWKLRQDPRVVVMERTNFRYVERSGFSVLPSVAIMDVSFISTRLLLPKLKEILDKSQDVVSLIKPQFEAGKGKVGKGGIVRDPQIHVEVLAGLLDFAYDSGFVCRGLDFSPITGGNGNIEYLAWWQGNPEEDRQSRGTSRDGWKQQVDGLVKQAWQEVSRD